MWVGCLSTALRFGAWARLHWRCISDSSQSLRQACRLCLPRHRCRRIRRLVVRCRRKKKSSVLGSWSSVGGGSRLRENHRFVSKKERVPIGSGPVAFCGGGESLVLANFGGEKRKIERIARVFDEEPAKGSRLRSGNRRSAGNSIEVRHALCALGACEQLHPEYGSGSKAEVSRQSVYAEGLGRGGIGISRKARPSQHYGIGTDAGEGVSAGGSETDDVDGDNLPWPQDTCGGRACEKAEGARGDRIHG